MNGKMAVIGVGNMAKAIINGIVSAQDICVGKIALFDRNEAQYEELASKSQFSCASSIADAVEDAELVLLSVKPQNFPEVLKELRAVPNHKDKIYISIAAGLSSHDISAALSGASVVRVLPNVPMLIGKGVSLICKNNAVASDDFEAIVSIFQSAGSIMLIDEENMNRMIGVTSSSPAYVFSFIKSIVDGAKAQGLSDDRLLEVVCDVVIGSALLLKGSGETPDALIAKVASKGGTTEKALEQLQCGHLDEVIQNAMIACTNRAEELGK